MFSLKRKSINQANKLPQTKNPYLDARAEWLERYGSYISRSAQWRAVALISLVILAVSVTGNVMQAKQSSVRPYVVELDKLGRVRNVAPLPEAVSIPRNMIQATIASAIVNWRTVTADTELQKQLISKLSAVTTGAAQGLLKQWFSEHNPYDTAKAGQLIHVEIKGLPLPVSDSSYRVEWIETLRNQAGALLDQQSYEATATIQLHPPQSEAAILANPGGIYITALSASKIITNSGR